MSETTVQAGDVFADNDHRIRKGEASSRTLYVLGISDDGRYADVRCEQTKQITRIALARLTDGKSYIQQKQEVSGG